MSKTKRGTVKLRKYLLDLHRKDMQFVASQIQGVREFQAAQHAWQQASVEIALVSTKEALRTASDTNAQAIDRKIEVRFLEVQGRLDAIDKTVAASANQRGGVRIGTAQMLAMLGGIAGLILLLKYVWGTP